MKDKIEKAIDKLSDNEHRGILIAAAKGIYPQGDEKKLKKLIDKYLSEIKK